MLENLNILPVDRTNLLDCAKLFVRVFNSEPWNESWTQSVVTARLEDYFAMPGFYGLIAYNDMGKTEAVGLVLGCKERWDQKVQFCLKEMCVAPQGQGIGTTLLEALENDLEAQAVEQLYLHTARETPAQAFYERRGFYESSRIIMMSKSIKDK